METRHLVKPAVYVTTDNSRVCTTTYSPGASAGGTVSHHIKLVGFPLGSSLSRRSRTTELLHFFLVATDTLLLWHTEFHGPSWEPERHKADTGSQLSSLFHCISVGSSSSLRTMKVLSHVGYLIWRSIMELRQVVTALCSKTQPETFADHNESPELSGSESFWRPDFFNSFAAVVQVLLDLEVWRCCHSESDWISQVYGLWSHSLKHLCFVMSGKTAAALVSLLFTELKHPLYKEPVGVGDTLAVLSLTGSHITESFVDQDSL